MNEPKVIQTDWLLWFHRISVWCSDESSFSTPSVPWPNKWGCPGGKGKGLNRIILSIFTQLAHILWAAHCGETKTQQFQSFMFALLAAYYEM